VAAAGSTRDVGNRHRAELFFAASEEWGGREVEGQGSNHSVGSLGRRRGEDEGMWLCFDFLQRRRGLCMCRNVVKGAWGSEQECGIEIASCMLICCNFSDLAQGLGSLSRGYVL